MKNLAIVFFFVVGIVSGTFAQTISSLKLEGELVQVGASRIGKYIPILKNKQIAIVGNQTSVVGKTHLVDTLVSLNIKINAIFCPEHGFRGEAEAGADVASSTDKKTGIPVISLYGNNKKPTPDQLKGIELVVFDLQDVGVRFYTYISTLHYVMEACAENNIPLIVLDRPNPNCFIDGPVLKPDCKSFVGMHPVPIAYGMTIGEYARMINGERWLENDVECELTVIPLGNYTHATKYNLPVPPSPNLSTMQAIYLYPTLCLFEGTPFSVGRGTKTPFEVLGHPDNPLGDYCFTPIVIPGKAENPPCLGKECRGFLLTDFAEEYIKKENSINLFWIIDLYSKFPEQNCFFTSFFDRLAGDKSLRQMLLAGVSEEDIRGRWKTDLENFKIIRKKYLLYSDIEHK